MFTHTHHQKILHILQALDASVFHKTGAHFGGGTLITLLYGEYRWSKDIDFICPVGTGYRDLRSLVNDAGNKPSIFFSHSNGITFTRDIKADQYGIRFPVMVDEVVIKIEIIAESRITLNTSAELPWLTVPCLDFADCCSEKLLANADRWNDSAIESRDLIDLAVLRLQSALPAQAISKAEQAYPVIAPLIRALDKFQNTPSYRDKCFTALQIQNRALILEGINLLSRDFVKQ